MSRQYERHKERMATDIEYATKFRNRQNISRKRREDRYKAWMDALKKKHRDEYEQDKLQDTVNALFKDI